jgi:hypothetical protein
VGEPRRLLLALLLAAAPLRAQVAWTGEVGVRVDDNPGNGGEADEIVKTRGTFAAIGLEKAFRTDGAWTLRVDGGLRAETFTRARGLDNVALTFSAALRRKWGLGPYAPWTELQVRAGREQFQETLRSVWRSEGALRAGQRIAPWLDLGGEARVERRLARAGVPDVPGLSGDAFSSTGLTARLWGELDLGSDCYLTLSGLRRHGDVSLDSTGEVDEYPAAKAAVEDPTFGPDFYAYRAPGTTRGGRAALLWACTDRTALELAWERLRTEILAGGTYTRTLGSLSLKVRF